MQNRKENTNPQTYGLLSLRISLIVYFTVNKFMLHPYSDTSKRLNSNSHYTLHYTLYMISLQTKPHKLVQSKC